MARKINVRKILEELIKKASHNSIASSWHVSKHSVSAVAEKGIQLGILPGGPIPDIDDDDLYKLFFRKRSLLKRYMNLWTLKKFTMNSTVPVLLLNCFGRSIKQSVSAPERMR